ncbi:MAG: butyrate kinase [Candidatus Wallbacteria bacterium]|nr:butyrate kinase [Candidatus Wallbacteria bacterium]
MKQYRLLVINPGSTSTKTAVYEGDKELFSETIRHDHNEIEKYQKIIDQYEFRSKIIESQLRQKGIELSSLDAVVARGGLLKPIRGGVFEVNEKMISDLKKAERGEHASNLGAIIARDLAAKIKKPSYIVDPVVVDEMDDIARLSGLPEIDRISIFHALNQKATARRAARELGKKYEDITLIVAHMGGGITIGAHKKGRVIDVNNGLNGDGPFSPERTGDLPVSSLVKMCFSGKYTEPEIQKKIKGKGGLMAYLNTADAREVEKMVDKGDKKAALIYEAMAYQVAKEIGALSTVLCGKIDGIVLTGGLAYDKRYIKWITDRVSFLGRVFVYPGEDEMEALRDGGLRVLSGEETANGYN